MHPTLSRGVTAALVMGALLTGGTVTALATGAEAAARPVPVPLPAAVQEAALHPAGMPDVSAGLRAAARLHRQQRRAAIARRRRLARERAAHRAYLRALHSDPRTAAHALMLNAGFGESEWACLDALWWRESAWNAYADNPGSDAYGIPQALPGSRMAAFGSDWRSNPLTQIRWGLWYIGATYGTPCAALAHSNAHGYY